MTGGDVHTPTSAGPAADKSPTFGPPPGGPADTPALERPEVQVGAAFAGGLLFALILKRLGG
ncbi:MAG TPA: hypothetical protein VGJ70_26545 [Solirubrobacteraceae bacterium]|jgi:hypothetical protein